MPTQVKKLLYKDIYIYEHISKGVPLEKEKKIFKKIHQSYTNGTNFINYIFFVTEKLED